MTPRDLAVPGPRLQRSPRHFIVLSLVLIGLALSAAPAFSSVDPGPTPATRKDVYYNNTLLFWGVLLVLIWLRQEPRVVESAMPSGAAIKRGRGAFVSHDVAHVITIGGLP